MNEVYLVDRSKLLEKSFEVPGYFSRVVSTSDIYNAEKIEAIPVSKCKSCAQYVPREQIELRRRSPDEEPLALKIVQKPKVAGEWEWYDYDIGCYRHTGFRCSNCHTEYNDDPFYSCGRGLRFKYCPSCGAKMKEAAE